MLRLFLRLVFWITSLFRKWILDLWHDQSFFMIENFIKLLLEVPKVTCSTFTRDYILDCTDFFFNNILCNCKISKSFVSQRIEGIQRVRNLSVVSLVNIIPIFSYNLLISELSSHILSNLLEIWLLNLLEPDHKFCIFSFKNYSILISMISHYYYVRISVACIVFFLGINYHFGLWCSITWRIGVIPQSNSIFLWMRI